MTLDSAVLRKEKPLLKFLDITRLDVSDIRSNPLNPRDDIASKQVEDLKQSIREVGGVLQPVVVYKEEDHYVLLDGERRWRASRELAKEDPKFSKIPANIIDKPIDALSNLKTMFNIHYKREGWTTAALAEALGEFEHLLGSNVSAQEISRITGVKAANIAAARIFLDMPQHIRNRCLKGELPEYYVILLGRNLLAIDASYPSLTQRYKRNHLIEAFIKKVDLGFVRDARSFNLLSRMARLTIENDSEKLFESTFDRLVNDVQFTPTDARDEIMLKLGPKLQTSLQVKCKEFLAFLESYTRRKKVPIDDSTRLLLQKIKIRIEPYL